MKRKRDPKELKRLLKGAERRLAMYEGYVAAGNQTFVGAVGLEREQIRALRFRLGLES